MNDRENLLFDVLAEMEPEGLRAALLDETLRLAGRRRRIRRARRVAATAALVLLGALSGRFLISPRTPAIAPMTSCLTVHTRALSAGAIVSTRKLDAAGWIVSRPGVAVVLTNRNPGRFRDLTDDELLVLIVPRPAGLVRLGPHSEMLVFATPADRENWLSN